MKRNLKYQIRNALRWPWIRGLIATKAAQAGANIGMLSATSELRAVKIKKDGTREDLGVLGRRVVTTAFVNEMVDQLQAEDSTWGDFKWHDSGVGTTAEAVGDTDIETTDGESRVSGTQVEGASANIYRSVGTINYTTTKSITEHGLFNASTAGILMDRTVFTAIPMENGDAIQFTYELTVNAGG